jgi:hypothetical protein
VLSLPQPPSDSKAQPGDEVGPAVHVLPLYSKPAGSTSPLDSLSDADSPIPGAGSDTSASSSAGSDSEGDAAGADPAAHAFGSRAVAFAVALSRASNHPVSRAMLAYGAAATEAGVGQKEEVTVAHFQQVGLVSHSAPTEWATSRLLFGRRCAKPWRIMLGLGLPRHAQAGPPPNGAETLSQPHSLLLH